MIDDSDGDGVDAIGLTRERMRAAVAAGDLEAAASWARSLAHCDATLPRAGRADLSRILVALATRAERYGDTDVAMSCVDAALLLDPDDVDAHGKKWALCQRVGDSYGVATADKALHRLTLARVERHPLAGTGLRFFNPNLMITRIGELAQQLDTAVKAQKLGWLPPMHCVLLAPPRHVVNAAYLDCWRPHVPVVSDPALIAALTPLARELDFDPIRLAVPGHGVLHKVHAHKIVQRAWEAGGHPPLLRLTETHHREGWRRLRHLGMGDRDWFVCLHVREAGYLRAERNDPDHPHRFRNADVSTYLPAIDEIVRRGGWVVRIGDTSVAPLPPMDRVVDYARCDDRCDLMDVFLCAESRFMLGTSSGPVVVAMTFGTPTIMSNITPLSHTAPAARDLFLPKLIRNRRDGRILPLSEMLRPPFRDLLRGDRLRALGYEVVDNSPADLRDATLEMLDRVDGRPLYEAGDEALNAAVRDLFMRTDNIIQGRIARDFLRRHRDLVTRA